jgi:hypothetical protein
MIRWNRSMKRNIVDMKRSNRNAAWIMWSLELPPGASPNLSRWHDYSRNSGVDLDPGRFVEDEDRRIATRVPVESFEPQRTPLLFVLSPRWFPMRPTL